MVSNNGVLQEPTNAYTVSGTTLSFTEAPESADKISVRVFSNITSLDKIQDADGDTKIEVESTSDDDTIRFSTAGTERLTIDSTGIELTTTEDSSSAGPIITLKRNSSSPADGDYLGQLKFQGENDADQEVLYAKITGKISDVTDTTEDGLLEFSLRKAGSNHIGARLTSTDLKLINSTGLEVAGNTTLSGTLNTHTIPSGTGTLALKKTPQVGTFTTSQNTTSTSYVDVTGYTTSITTTEANSKLKVNLVITRSGDAGKIKLVRTVGATNTDIIEVPFLSGDGNLTSSYIDSPSESAGTTVTYKIQHLTNVSGTVYVNYGTTNNQISIEEL